MKNNGALERLIHNWPVKILCMAAAIVLFLFHRTMTMEERFFSLPINVIIDDNYISAIPFPRTARVTLRGIGEEVFLILEDDLEVVADFSAYSRDGTFTVPVMIRKRETTTFGELMDIRVEPSELTLRLEEKLVKSVEIAAGFSGYPAKGYELTQTFLTPSTVEIEGVRSAVESVTEVRTVDIDITGKKEDFTVRVRLQAPGSGVVFPGGEIVEVFGTIRESVILRTLENVDIIAMDLRDNLTIHGLQSSNSIRIQGRQLQLEDFGPQDYRLTVDCSGIDSPGEYELPVRPDVPQGVLVLRYEPASVIITVSRTDSNDGIEEQEQ